MIAVRITEVLNRALAESAKARDFSAALTGRLLHVVVKGTPFAGSLRSEGATVRFTMGALPDGTTADATISGSALSLAGLMSERQRELIHSGAVQISGDGEIAAKFSELATLLKPDVEHELSGLFGRMPAHLLVSGVRSLFARGRALFNSQLHTAADYLAHEKQALVPQAEAEHFFKQVDALREQVDRVAARIVQLERRP
jgi:ubiquinone biosynthesis protein UbiJ